jgi:hypothetical protein
MNQPCVRSEENNAVLVSQAGVTGSTALGSHVIHSHRHIPCHVHLLNHAMARWSLFALLVAALTGLAQTKPLAQDSLKDSNTIRIAESWAYSNCGESGAFHEVVVHPVES